MNAYQVIARKRDGHTLSPEEIEFFIQGFARGTVADYQMSAFLMSVFFRGMDLDETVGLTRAMMNTGKILDLSSIEGRKVDKHSTGGVGDKVSLVLAPLLAAAGVKVPMVSGRTLGHTGGTLDKLESIPGLRTNLTAEQFANNVASLGFAIAAQSKEFVPADAGMYALRGVTGTVESVPLIVSSILSKKFAAGIDSIVFDVKCGGGAFMQDRARARELARQLVTVTSVLGKTGRALLTDMEQPLGCAVGNSLEVRETIDTLKGGGPKDLLEVVMELGAEMLSLAEIEQDRARAVALLRGLLSQGKALEKFTRFIEAQGGNPGVVEDGSLLPRAREVKTVTCGRDGCLSAIDTRGLGELCVDMGGGRRRHNDEIDPSVGFVLKTKVSDTVRSRDPLVEVHYDPARGDVTGSARRLFTISEDRVRGRELILERIA
ncbi:MAG: thymidine phosphorylase [Candidatus Eisenbacteria bacterium]